MKKNYKVSWLLFLCLIASFSLFAQNKLSSSQYGALITEYLKTSTKTSKASSTKTEDIFVTREVYSEKTGIVNVYLNQTYKGIKIFNAISSVGIKNNKVFHFADNFKGEVLINQVNTSTPSLSVSQAIQKAVSHFSLGTLTNLNLLEVKNGKEIYSNGGVSQENIPVEQVYFELQDGSLKLAWDLSIYTLDSNHWWSVRVDAVTGEVLDISDWVISCSFDGDHTTHGSKAPKPVQKEESFKLFKTNNVSVADGSQYNVFELPIESPFHGSVGVVSEPADDTASPFGWHDTDGVVGPEYTITRGNNVWAYDDINSDEGATGISPDGTSSLNFNFPLNLNQAPAGYLDVATTNLFYMNNMMHDILYVHGFDEASGNFQENNYGKGGEEGDSVAAQSQDGGGVNNANFTTPPDGSNGRMQMFLWFAAGIAQPLVINGGSLDGIYPGFYASFGAPLTATPITGDLAIVVDDNSGGTSTDPNDACDVITNGAELAGKIALLNRGTCEFGVKVLAAENAGAIGVIIITDDRDAGPMGPGASGNLVTIPSIMIDRVTGDAILAAIVNGETINVSLSNEGPYQRDGSFDNGIIAHEYAHGISTRLTGGADNSNCLNSTFQAGEGWSDWFALMTTMKATDVGETGRGIGTFAVNQPNDGLGIRERRYSTDFAINNYTYEDTNDNSVFGTDPDTGDPIILNRFIYHHGEIWASMLWDLTWAYIDKYGFNPNFLSDNGGNNKVMKVVIEGMKLQGCGAEYLEARDAILAADLALTGGEDQCMIWEVFARRGLGVNASEGIPFVLEDQVADFTTPDSSDPSLANCTAALSTTDFNSRDYKVYPNPASTKLTISASKAMGDVVIDLVDINGRKVLSKSTTLSGEVELNTSKLQSGLYILRIKGEYINTYQKILIK